MAEEGRQRRGRGSWYRWIVVYKGVRVMSLGVVGRLLELDGKGWRCGALG
jgi:hypothetical protein